MITVRRIRERRLLEHDVQRDPRLVRADLLRRRARVLHATALTKARHQHHIAEPPGTVRAKRIPGHPLGVFILSGLIVSNSF